MPCSTNLYSWAILVNSNETAATIFEINPFTHKLANIFHYQHVDLDVLSLYDSLDSQYAVGVDKSSIALLDAQDGGTTIVSYSPDTTSLQGSFGLIIGQSDVILSLGGSCDTTICPFTPIIQLDLTSGQTTIVGCVPSDDYQYQVLSHDYNQNILYYSDPSFFIALNLNTSVELYQTMLPRVSNIYADSKNVWVTVGTFLGQLSNQKFVPKFDFGTVFPNATGSQLLSGANFDTSNGIMNGAFKSQNSIFFFMFDLENMKLINQYSDSKNKNLQLYSQMGWFCNEVSN